MDCGSSLEVCTQLKRAPEFSGELHASKKRRLSPPSVTEDAVLHIDPTYHGLCGTAKPSPDVGQQNVCFGMVRAVGCDASEVVNLVTRVALRSLGLNIKGGASLNYRWLVPFDPERARPPIVISFVRGPVFPYVYLSQ